jgi:hypothetical protein
MVAVRVGFHAVGDEGEATWFAFSWFLGWWCRFWLGVGVFCVVVVRVGDVSVTELVLEGTEQSAADCVGGAGVGNLFDNVSRGAGWVSFLSPTACLAICSVSVASCVAPLLEVFSECFVDAGVSFLGAVFELVEFSAPEAFDRCSGSAGVLEGLFRHAEECDGFVKDEVFDFIFLAAAGFSCDEAAEGW